MRKDVKLGLAVGGVLLAVLVVYVLVVPGNSNTNQAGARLEGADSEQSTAGAAGIGDAAEGTGATASRTGSTDIDAAASGTGSAGSTQDQQANAKTSGGSAADTGSATNAGSTGGANDATGSSSANTGATTNDRQRGETAGGGWNWDALVNGTEKLPSLGAATDVRTGDALPSNNVGAAGGSIVDGGNADGATSGSSALAGNANAIASNGADSGVAGNTANSATGNATDASASPARDATSLATGIPDTSTTGARHNLANGQTVAQTRAAITAATPGKHVVKAGDTYSKISLAVYGSSKHYADIEHANPGIDPTRLKPGMTINLPAIEARPAAARIAPQQEQALDARTQYKVQPNDSLYTISLRLYGKADRMEKIYELNKAAIGDDMARVKVGMVLKLPEPPTQTVATGR